MVSVRYYTDPACPWSWALEPSVRKLMVQFGDGLGWTFVMGGLARDWAQAGGSSSGGDERTYAGLIRQWLEVAAETGAPLDPLLWVDGPPRTSYPACMGVKAAAEQADDGGYRYLRRLREGLMCERRRLDHAEVLVEEARAAGLDVERFRIALRSHATTEAFGADLEQTKTLGGEPGDASGSCSSGAGGAALPSIAFRGGGGEQVLSGLRSYEAYREAAIAAGAEPLAGTAPTVEEAVARFGRVTTAEVELICELPGPRAGAELFRLAEQWKLRSVWRMTGYLWESSSRA